jgi:ribonuclease PH
MPTPRSGRRADELRPLTFDRGYVRTAAGSVLVRAGGTAVICTASVDPGVPAWLAGKGRGWLTAEYAMLPASTRPRKKRDRGPSLDGRATEIQRLIGRSLRAVVDLDRLGEATITIDCDVLEADGGTRTASITGAWVALADALDAARELVPAGPAALVGQVAAVSVGVVDGEPRLDLDYDEDSSAEVDMNIVMTGSGTAGASGFVEVQGTAERGTFDDAALAAMISLGRAGVGRLLELQSAARR